MLGTSGDPLTKPNYLSTLTKQTIHVLRLKQIYNILLLYYEDGFVSFAST